ncbi:hypothetical protein D3C86_2073800 [compost metagenome]
MVIGLVNQTRLTAIGMLPRSMIARQAARSICIGIGMNAANRPTAMALATE